LVIAAPTGFRALQLHPAFAAARKPADTTISYAIIPQSDEKCGPALRAKARFKWFART
jgi:hypothetical protein